MPKLSTRYKTRARNIKSNGPDLFVHTIVALTSPFVAFKKSCRNRKCPFEFVAKEKQNEGLAAEARKARKEHFDKAKACRSRLRMPCLFQPRRTSRSPPPSIGLVMLNLKFDWQLLVRVHHRFHRLIRRLNIFMICYVSARQRECLANAASPRLRCTAYDPSCIGRRRTILSREASQDACRSESRCGRRELSLA